MKFNSTIDTCKLILVTQIDDHITTTFTVRPCDNGFFDFEIVFFDIITQKTILTVNDSNFTKEFFNDLKGYQKLERKEIAIRNYMYDLVANLRTFTQKDSRLI